MRLRFFYKRAELRSDKLDGDAKFIAFRQNPNDLSCGEEGGLLARADVRPGNHDVEFGSRLQFALGEKCQSASADILRAGGFIERAP